MAVILGTVLAGQSPTTIRPTFDSPESLRDWTLDGSGEWRVTDGVLALAKEGTPAGPIRRPGALAILKSEPVGRVTLELDVRSTAPEDLAVRDVNLVVGYESPTRFYYVHLSAVTDAVHNGIFVVADADRRRIDPGTTPPLLKDLAWHRVKIERDPASGCIDVFVDDLTKAAMSAVDTTIRSGRVGVGSFDETGEFRNIVVTGAPR
jgi:hypothetical protein